MQQDWQQTLEAFRQFGGIADNVSLCEGKYGRGLCPTKIDLPVTLKVPHHLLVQTNWLQVDDFGKFYLSDACNWPTPQREFYLTYLEQYGLSKEVLAEMRTKQMQRYALPDQVKAMLMGFGMPELLFQSPTLPILLDTFKASRRILVDNESYLMPVVELVNHSQQSKAQFTNREELVGINGRFNGELFVSYGNNGDAFAMYCVYGFSDVRPYSFSGALSVNLGARSLKISRLINLHDKLGQAKLPKVKLVDNDVHLSFLVLGSLVDKKSPAKIFEKLMQGIGMPKPIALEVFEGIKEQNKAYFLGLIEQLKPLQGEVVDDLRAMAKNQLLPLGVSL